MTHMGSKVSELRFVEHWPRGPGAEHAAAIVRFWQDESGFGSEAAARRRLPEVVMHAQDANGAVVAVCTAAPMLLPKLGQPMYYYRCLIGRAWRKSVLVMVMIRRTTFLLEDYAVASDYPCIGIVIELENERFDRTLDSPVWPNPERRGYVYIGKSRDGLDLRVFYFRGARLKR
jgi:hypothetical protein